MLNMSSHPSSFPSVILGMPDFRIEPSPPRVQDEMNAQPVQGEINAQPVQDEMNAQPVQDEMNAHPAQDKRRIRYDNEIVFSNA